MFEIIKRKAIASEILKQYYKSERQLNVSELGRALDMLKLADNEDAGVNTRKVTDPMQQHEWVNIAVDFRARNLARCDFKLYRGKNQEITKGPEYDLFNNVNPYMDKYQLWEATETWRMIRGEAIWILTGPNKARLSNKEIPTEIYIGDPSLWSAVINKSQTKIMKWLFQESEEKEPIPYSLNEIIHFRIYNKWNKWRGVDYWRAQEENIEQDYEAARSNTSLIKNKSIPPGIFSVPQAITEKFADEMVKRWEKKHKGSLKTGRIGVIGHGATYQPIAMTHADMQYFEMKKWNRVTILAKAGIPPVLVSVKDESTPLSGTDTKEQQKVFWSQTMEPEHKSLEDKLRTDFFDRFDIPMFGKFDTENIQELQEDYGAKVEKGSKLFAMGVPFNDINEKLELGFDKYDWGDTGYVSISLKPIRTDEAEGPGPQPPPLPFMQTESKQNRRRWIVSYIIGSQRRWGALEDNYRSAVKKWMYEARKYYLDRYAKSVSQKQYNDFLFWVGAEESLIELSEGYFNKSLDLLNTDLSVIFKNTGFSSEFDIYNINTEAIINERLDNLTNLTQSTREAIDTVVREGINNNFTTEQMMQALKTKFTEMGDHVQTIARTEMGVVKSRGIYEAYDHEKIQRIEWIHTGGGLTDRLDHIALDGQVNNFNDPFYTNSGSLRYPRDPAGALGDIINCYCEFVPAIEGI